MSTRKKKKAVRFARLASWTLLVVVMVGGLIGFLVWRTGGFSGSVPPPVDVTHLTPARQKVLQSRYENLLKNRRNGEAWGSYGIALRAFDFESPSVEAFRQAARLDPKDPRWPYFLARALRDENPSEAYSYLKTASELTGNSPPVVRYYLAKWLGEEGKLEQADVEAAGLLSAHPDFNPARLLRAQIAFQRGELDKASELLRPALSDPRTRKAAFGLWAGILQRQGKGAEAIKMAQDSANAPRDDNIYDDFEAQVSALRGDPRVLSDQVHPLLADRKLAEAAPLIEQLIREHPDFSETWLVRARQLLLQKNLAQAEQALRKHLELNPDSIQGWFQLGMVYMGAQNWSSAIETFGQATKLKTDFGPAWYNLGFSYGREGKLEESAKAFSQAIRCNPERIDSYFLLGDVQARLGRMEEVERLLQAAEKINPADPRIAALRRRAAGLK